MNANHMRIRVPTQFGYLHHFFSYFPIFYTLLVLVCMARENIQENFT